MYRFQNGHIRYFQPSQQNVQPIPFFPFPPSFPFVSFRFVECFRNGSARGWVCKIIFSRDWVTTKKYNFRLIIRKCGFCSRLSRERVNLWRGKLCFGTIRNERWCLPMWNIANEKYWFHSEECEYKQSFLYSYFDDVRFHKDF